MRAIVGTVATETRPARISGYDSRRLQQLEGDVFEAEFVISKTIDITAEGAMIGECNITEQVPVLAKSLEVEDVMISQPTLNFPWL